MNERRSVGSRVFDGFDVFLLILFALLCVFPFYYMIVYSLSDPAKAASGILLFPTGFTLQNYVEVIQLKSISRAFLVSVARSVLGPALTLVCCSFFAYLVSKPEMYLRKLIYRMLIITMYVGGGLIPTYLTYRAYGLRNTFWVYILPSALCAYNVVLIKTYVESLPKSLEESAMLDGAGVLTIWARIILPLSKPILATVAVFAIVAQWNSWFDAHIYMTRTDLQPLQYVLYNYLNEAQALAAKMQRDVGHDVDISALTPASVRMTITTIVTLPIMLVYPFLQRYFVKGLLLGSVKG